MPASHLGEGSEDAISGRAHRPQGVRGDACGASQDREEQVFRTDVLVRQAIGFEKGVLVRLTEARAHAQFGRTGHAGGSGERVVDALRERFGVCLDAAKQARHGAIRLIEECEEKVLDFDLGGAPFLGMPLGGGRRLTGVSGERLSVH